MNTERYWLKAPAIPGSDWVETTKEAWIIAERAAGFRPKLPSDDPKYMEVCATGGFGSLHAVSGCITFDGNPPRQPK